METSKLIVNKLFILLDTSKTDIINQFKTELILLLENESKINKFKYSHNDKFNQNDIELVFNGNKDNNSILIDENKLNNLKSKDKNTRYLACKNILKDFYNQIGNIRKYKLITNKKYFSNYILKLAKSYLINNNFTSKNSNYINDEVSRYIKKNKGNILLKYPILSLEYDINTYDRKSISNLYNDMKIYNEEHDNGKKLYYELINNSLNYIIPEDINDLIEENNNYELLKYFNELKDYNDKNKLNNTNVNNLIKIIEKNINSDSSNLYKIIYGGK